MSKFSTTISHPYAYAQEMNEIAARCLEDGHCEKAILALTKTLQVWKECETKDKNAETCFCHECSPCAMVCDSETDSNEGERDRLPILPTATNSPCASSSAGHQSPCFESEDEMENASGFDCGYLYQKLQRIPCRKRFGNTNVGSAVAFITIFNLAIVHHVSASRSNFRFKMERTLRLYQLANDCLNKYIAETHGCSCEASDDETGVLFQMILLNNLSHLHTFMGDHSMSQKCIERLIPILMCVIDDSKIRNDIESKTGSLECACLEGFFRNISPHVLTSQCADAA